MTVADKLRNAPKADFGGAAAREKAKDCLTKEETVIRQAASCWMVGYQPMKVLWVLTKDEQVTGFAHTQKSNAQLIRTPVLTIPLAEFGELDNLSRITRKPAFLVAGFSDFNVYVHTDMLKRPLDVRMVGKQMLVHMNAGQWSRLTYEAKW